MNHGRSPPPPARDRKSRWGLRGKTVWDWLQLLIVPLMLALVTVVFTWQQNVRQNELEEQRVEQGQKIENQRAEAERELAVQRAQDQALQAYLDQMSMLLLEKELRASDPDSEVRTLAQARTSTVLERLDPSRRTEVMGFLLEAELIQQVDGRDLIIALRGANLSGAELPGYPLGGIVLTGVDLSDAYLGSAVLRGTDLRFADLSGADLHFADLSGADLSDLGVSGTGANLRGAQLNDAVLSGADLSGVKITDEQLEQASSLDDATMPNGQKYEDWLKSKGRGEDG